MKIQMHRSSLATHIARVLALTLVLGSFTGFAGKRPGGGGGTGGGRSGGGTTNTTTKPPTPTNFRVTAKTAYTISVAWDVAESTSDYSFHLSGAYHVTPAILPKTARSHTFTALAPGNDYWLFIYTRDAAGTAGGQVNLGPIVLPRDTTPPWTAPVVSIGEIGANYAHLSWTRAQDDGSYHYSYELRQSIVQKGLSEGCYLNCSSLPRASHHLRCPDSHH